MNEDDDDDEKHTATSFVASSANLKTNMKRIQNIFAHGICIYVEHLVSACGRSCQSHREMGVFRPQKGVAAVLSTLFLTFAYLHTEPF